MIENTIKKEFSCRVKENHYNEALGMEYKLKLPELVSELSGRKYEYQIKEEELVESKRKMEDIVEAMKAKEEKYLHLNEGRMSLNTPPPSA